MRPCNPPAIAQLRSANTSDCVVAAEQVPGVFDDRGKSCGSSGLTVPKHLGVGVSLYGERSLPRTMGMLS